MRLYDAKLPAQHSPSPETSAPGTSPAPPSDHSPPAGEISPAPPAAPGWNVWPPVSPGEHPPSSPTTRISPTGNARTGHTHAVDNSMVYYIQHIVGACASESPTPAVLCNENVTISFVS